MESPGEHETFDVLLANRLIRVFLLVLLLAAFGIWNWLEASRWVGGEEKGEGIALSARVVDNAVNCRDEPA